MDAKRGFVPEDVRNFSPESLEKMRTASRHICYLINEGYDLKQATTFVVENGATGVPFREQVPAFVILVEQPAKVVPFVKAHYGDTQRFAQGDIGMAAMNMCYQALELGLSTCILGLNDQKKMEQYFGIPEGSEVRMVLAVGYAAKDEPPRKKIRRPVEEICSFNQW